MTTDHTLPSTGTGAALVGRRQRHGVAGGHVNNAASPDMPQPRGLRMSLHHGNAIGEFNNTGQVRTQEEMQLIRRKNGVCVRCGITQTHVKPKKVYRALLGGLKPITNENVYKGVCLRCHGGVAKVKQSLGEELSPVEAASLARPVLFREDHAMRNLSSIPSTRLRTGSGDTAGRGSPLPTTTNSSRTRMGPSHEADNNHSTAQDDARFVGSSGSETAAARQENHHHRHHNHQSRHAHFADDDDSTRPVMESSRRLRVVDTGAMLLESSGSTNSYGHFVGSLDLELGRSQNAAIVQEEMRQERRSIHLFGKLNRTNSWDGSVAAPSVQDGLSIQLNKPASLHPAMNNDVIDVDMLRRIAEEQGLDQVVEFMISHKSNSSIIFTACDEIKTRAPALAAAALGSSDAFSGADAVRAQTLKRERTLAITNILPPIWMKCMLAAIEEQKNDVVVLRELLQTIWVVASLHKRFKADVCDVGGANSVAKVMKNYQSDKVIQLFGCGLFVSLLADDAHASTVKNSQIFQHMLTLSNQSESAISTYALRSLFLLYDAIEKNSRSAFYNADAIACLVKAMHRHLQSSSVQETAIDLLWKISAGEDPCFICPLVNNNEKGDDNPRSVLNDIIGAVGTATSTHAGEKTIQIGALSLLYNLCSRMVAPIARSMADRFSRAIVTAMINCPERCTLSQRYGCLAITSLLGYSSSHMVSDVESEEYITPYEVKAMFTEHKAIDAVVRALAQPWLDNTLLGDACDALTSLCIDVPSNKEILISAGGIRMSVDIIRANAGLITDKARYVRDSASRMLATLVFHSQGMIKIDDLKFCKEIISMTVEGSTDGSPISPLLMNLLTAQSTSEDESERVSATTSVVSNVLQKYCCADEAEHGLALLSALSNSDKCTNVLKARDIVDSILSSMEMFPDSQVIQKLGCGILSNIYVASQQDQNHQEQCDGGGVERPIETILNVIKVHKCRSEVQACALLCLRNLCCTFSESIASITSATAILREGISSIVEAIDISKESFRVQENVPGIFWALGGISSPIRDAVLASGCIQRTTNTILDFLDDNSIQSDALGCLAAFSTDPDVMSSLATTKGMGSLLAALHNFKDEPEQCRRACILLAAASWNSHVARMEIIDKDEALDLILSCIQVHVNNAGVLVEAYDLLASVAIDDLVQRALKDGGVVANLESAIGCFPDEMLLQRKACELLCAIVNVIPSDEIFESNVLGGIIQSASMHEEDETIQLKSIESLWIIAAKGAANKQEVASFGGVEVIVAAMIRHMRTSAVVEKGCVCLWCLAFDNQTSILIGQRSGPQVIVEAMMTHVDKLQLQLEALGALKTLAVAAENKDIIQKSPAINAIVLSMWAHASNSSVQEAALMALTNISVIPATNEVLAITHSELEVVLGAMRKFPESEAVQEQACMLIRNYSFKNSNLDLMRSNPLVFQALADAMERHPSKCGERAEYVIGRFYGE